LGTALDGTRFNTYTAVFKASLHKNKGNSELLSSDGGRGGPVGAMEPPNF